jgi:hypothetical protein
VALIYDATRPYGSKVVTGVAAIDDQRVGKGGDPVAGAGSGFWKRLWLVRSEIHIPYSFANNQAIARIATEHFLDRGFWHFAYCGYPRTPINGWSEERELAFRKQLRDRKFECHVYRAGQPADGGSSFVSGRS